MKCLDHDQYDQKENHESQQRDWVIEAQKSSGSRSPIVVSTPAFVGLSRVVANSDFATSDEVIG